MSSYTIEKDYNVPAPGRGRFAFNPERRTVYAELPLDRMARGDSFIIPVRYHAETRDIQKNTSSAVCKFVNNYAPTRKFATRVTKGGVRVFRVK